MSDHHSGGPDAQRYRILAIHAHPDDESSKGAATMARYVDEGHRVKVLTCTGGERGDILNPQLAASLETDAALADDFDMASWRRREMDAAAAILGIEHEWLGYEDSGLPETPSALPDGCFALQPTAEITDRIVALIRDFRPHVLITYDENGGYPHPDHLKVHAVSMRAFDAAADPEHRPDLGAAWEVRKLYYTHGFVRTRFEALEDALRIGDTVGDTAGEPAPALADALREFSRYTTVPDISHRVTTRVMAADWFHRRDDALRAHATQIDPEGPFFLIDLDTQRQIWPTEEFELALTRIPTSFPEECLFDGLAEHDRGGSTHGPVLALGPRGTLPASVD